MSDPAIQPGNVVRLIAAPSVDTDLTAAGYGAQPARVIVPLADGVLHVTDASGGETSLTVGTNWPKYQALPVAQYVTLNSETAVDCLIAW